MTSFEVASTLAGIYGTFATCTYGYGHYKDFCHPSVSGNGIFYKKIKYDGRPSFPRCDPTAVMLSHRYGMRLDNFYYFQICEAKNLYSYKFPLFRLMDPEVEIQKTKVLEPIFHSENIGPYHNLINYNEYVIKTKKLSGIYTVGINTKHIGFRIYTSDRHFAMRSTGCIYDSLWYLHRNVFPLGKTAFVVGVIGYLFTDIIPF